MSIPLSSPFLFRHILLCISLFAPPHPRSPYFLIRIPFSSLCVPPSPFVNNFFSLSYSYSSYYPFSSPSSSFPLSYPISFFPIRTPPPSVTFFELSLLTLFFFRNSPPSPFLIISLILWFSSFPVPLSFFFRHLVFFSVLISSRLSKGFFLSSPSPFRSYSFYSSFWNLISKKE